MTLTVDLQLFPTGEQPTDPPVDATQLYQVKHDAWMGDLWRTGVPEVYVMSENKTDFVESYQLLSYRINTTDNPLVDYDMSKDKWRVLYDDHRWGMNGTGFNNSSDPRRDYVNRRDLTAPYPKFDKARLFGGALLKGVEAYSVMQTLRDAAGLLLTMAIQPSLLAGRMRASLVSLVTNNVLQVETLKVQDAAPDLEWLLPRKWLYMDALNVTAHGISRFPQGMNGSRVFVLNLTSHVETYPLSKLVKLPIGYDLSTHDPYKL